MSPRQLVLPGLTHVAFTNALNDALIVRGDLAVGLFDPAGYLLVPHYIIISETLGETILVVQAGE